MGRHSTELADTSYRPRYSERYEFRHAAPKKGKRKLRSPFWARMCVFLGVLFVFVSSTAYGAQVFLTKRYEENINRADLLGENRVDRAAKVQGPMTFLILGTDKRVAEDFDPKDRSSNPAAVNSERADTIMVVHIPETMDKGYVISMPRDAQVFIPPKGDWDGGEEKINAAYNFGGVPLMVATVNRLLDIEIDYPVVANFKAIREITDAVGGVDVVIDANSFDDRSRRNWKKGKHHLDGKEAEDYVRQRYGLDAGDYDRQKRQQQFIQSLTKTIDKQGIVRSPQKIDKLLRIVTKNITVDKSMPVQSLVFALKHLRPTDVSYLTLAMAGSDGSYEFVDEAKVAELGKAIEGGTMPRYLAKNPPNDVSHGR